MLLQNIVFSDTKFSDCVILSVACMSLTPGCCCVKYTDLITPKLPNFIPIVSNTQSNITSAPNNNCLTIS